MYTSTVCLHFILFSENKVFFNFISNTFNYNRYIVKKWSGWNRNIQYGQLHTGRNSLAPNERNSQTRLHTASATLVHRTARVASSFLNPLYTEMFPTQRWKQWMWMCPKSAPGDGSVSGALGSITTTYSYIKKDLDMRFLI